MDQEFEWELIVTSGKEDLVPQLPRKICRTSILSRLSGAYDRCELGVPTLTDKVFNVIPSEGITASDISTMLNVEITLVYCSLTVLRRRGNVISVRVKGRRVKYYRTDTNIFETLTLPYRPKYP